jgi:hypothetical protein
LQRYVGSYRVDASTSVVIERDGGRLYAEATGTPRLELLATSETTFFVPQVDADLEFTIDGGGHTESFVVRFATGTVAAQRVR